MIRKVYNIYVNYRVIATHKILTKLLGPNFALNRQAIEIDLTYACNLSCINCNRSCPVAPSDNCISVVQIKKFIKESIDNNRQWKRIEIAGGEPTLHPDFIEIINLLLNYQNKYLTGCKMILSTNGYGNKVNEMLSLLPKKGIWVRNTEKRNSSQHFVTVHLAPRDLKCYRSADYSNGCYITSLCGIGFTPFGYYPCAIAGSIDRVFGFNAGRKKLPTEDDFMVDLLKLFCQYCGHFVGKKARKEIITPTWAEALKTYSAKKPELCAY